MQIENEFTVATPIEALWAFLLDVERVAPCMPGAELTETVDETTWRGKVTMKLGPVSLSFAGTVEMEERDDAAHRVKLRAKGMEQKGKGAANASITSWLEPAGGETTVRMSADIQLSGAVAQLSRGLLPEVTRRLTEQFAECLHATILADASGAATSVTTAEPGASSPPMDARDEPAAGPGERAPATATERGTEAIGGLRLGLAAIWGLIANLFRRLFGGKPRA